GILPIKALSAEGSVKNLPRNLGFSGMWHPAHLSHVVANGVADRAGLKAGDTIKNINGRVIHDARELLQTIQSLSAELPANFVVERSNTVVDITLTPYKVEVPVIGVLDEQDPAYLAGMREGDVVIGMNSQPVADHQQLNEMLQAANQQSPSEWLVSRKGLEVKVHYAAVPVAMTVLSKNKIDVMLGGYDTVHFGFFESLSYGVDHSYWISRSILTSVGQMFAGKVKVQDNLSGPIEIATIASKSAQRGISDYVLVLIQISISLAILNLLPLPVLDGGHLFLYMIEAVRGKPLPNQWIGVLQRIGVFLLLALMLFVTFNDILRRV
ncbi:MAG: RIP metalloprotease RseP, partial [Saezia sp.]